MTYGFAERTQYAYSVGITVGIQGAPQLSVLRIPMKTTFVTECLPGDGRLRQQDRCDDSIQRYNRKFIELLRILRPYRGTPVIDMLEAATLIQLETLSAYFGAMAAQG